MNQIFFKYLIFGIEFFSIFFLLPSIKEVPYAFDAYQFSAYPSFILINYT